LQFEYYQPPNVNDPVLALVGLRTEVDAMIRNLADSFGVDVSVGKTVQEQLSALRTGGAILDRQLRLATKVIELCDAAIRGVPVTPVEAEAVVEIAKVLAAEYVEWLSWGFPDRPWVDDPASKRDRDPGPDKPHAQQSGSRIPRASRQAGLTRCDGRVGPRGEAAVSTRRIGTLACPT
jgi:hypothetical protein